MGRTSAGLKADADAQDEPVDTTPPWLAVILRSPPAPHEAVGSTTAGPKADDDARVEPMDTTPPSVAVIFRSPPASHEAVGGATAGLLRTSDTHRAGGHPPGTRAPLPARLEVSCLCETAIQSQPTDKAMGSATAGLLRASDNHRAGGRRLVSPGPIRCRGRHRRRPRPYPQGGRRPDGHATAFGKGTRNCPLATDKSVGCTGASLKADAQDDEPMDTTPPSMAVIFRSPPAPHGAVGSSTFGPRGGDDDRDEPMDTTPPSMAVIFRSPPAAHGAVGGSTFGPKGGDDDRDEPMDTTPPSMAVIFRSPPAPHGAVGSTTFGPRAGDDARDEPMDTTPPSMAVIFRSPPAAHGAVGSSTFGPRAGDDAGDEPMDTTPPSMAVIFRSPPAPHGAVGSTTAGLLCASDNHRAGGRRLVSPGPIRCRGRHRRRPRPYPLTLTLKTSRWDTTPPSMAVIFRPPPPAPHEAVGSGTAGLPPRPHTMPWEAQTTASDRYPQVGLGPDGHATAIGKGTYSSPRAPDDAVGSTGAGPKAHSDSQGEPMDTTPPSLAVIFRSPPGPTPGRGHHHRRPPAHLRHPPRGRSSSGLPWTHTMPWEAQTTASALPPSRTMTRWARHHPRERHLQLIPGPRQGHGQDKRRP
ncbi:hypothetical protein MUG91_G5250n1 [Manis pentadactyla]|nr:hypothetical protein MUG91_G5250n1 [Manis pentadactyla]